MSQLEIPEAFLRSLDAFVVKLEESRQNKHGRRTVNITVDDVETVSSALTWIIKSKIALGEAKIPGRAMNETRIAKDIPTTREQLTTTSKPRSTRERLDQLREMFAGRLACIDEALQELDRDPDVEWAVNSVLKAMS